MELPGNVTFLRLLEIIVDPYMRDTPWYREARDRVHRFSAAHRWMGRYV